MRDKRVLQVSREIASEYGLTPREESLREGERPSINLSRPPASLPLSSNRPAEEFDTKDEHVQQHQQHPREVPPRSRDSLWKCLLCNGSPEEGEGEEEENVTLRESAAARKPGRPAKPFLPVLRIVRARSGECILHFLVAMRSSSVKKKALQWRTSTEKKPSLLRSQCGDVLRPRRSGSRARLHFHTCEVVEKEATLPLRLRSDVTYGIRGTRSDSPRVS